LSIHPQKTKVKKSKSETIEYFAKNLAKQDQREAELIKITNSLNLAQEIAKIGSWDYDVKSNTIYCSDPLYDILGLEKDENVVPEYEDLLAMICLEDRDHFDHLFQQTKKSGIEMDIEYKIQKLDGSIITAHVRAVGKKDLNGKVTRIIGVLHDISELVLTENRLKESEEKIKNIATNIDLGIWSLDYLTKKVTFVSHAIEKISGYRTEDFLSGKINWETLIPPEDIENFRKQQEILHQGKMLNHSYRIIDLTGDVKWIENKTIPILNAEGQLIRLDGIVQDISVRKLAE
jgi:PAS domain S-box-containing protein